MAENRSSLLLQQRQNPVFNTVWIIKKHCAYSWKMAKYLWIIMQQKAHFVVSAYTSIPGNWSIPLMEQNPVLLFTASLRLQKRIIWIHSGILSICLIHWRIIRMIQIDHLLIICFRGLQNYRKYAGLNNFWNLAARKSGFY